MAFRCKIVDVCTPEMRKRFKDMSHVEHRLALYTQKIVDPYVPYRTGHLAISARSDGSNVVYDTPYAHWLYFKGTIPYEEEHGERKFDPTREKIHISRQYHPKAQTFWFYGAKMDHMVELRHEAVKLVKKELKIR